MSELHLWRAVIAQALDDATTKRCTGTAPLERRQARAWFKSAGPDFVETCALAGLEPSAVRQHALALIAQCRDPAIEPLLASDREPTKRGRKGKRIELDGINLTVAQWATRTGLSRSTIRTRLLQGWTVQAALRTRVSTERQSNLSKCVQQSEARVQ